MKAFLFFLLVVSTFLFARSQPSCGDGTCDPLSQETSVSCSRDCRCGDGVCDYSEHWIICSNDCLASCGDLVCTEGTTSCPMDCLKGLPTCGDAKCDIGETTVNCFTDCPTEDAGEGILYVLYIYNPDSPDNKYTCNVTVWDHDGNLTDQYEMAVVAYGKTVPDSGTYTFVAECDNFASGQRSYPLSLEGETSFLTLETEVCGNGRCISPEDSFSCPSDCGSEEVCGDGRCISPEDPFSCPQDCGSCSPNCFGRNCGEDGCGGVCGTCFDEQFCNNGVCQTVCSPNCFGRNCGDDGCGGSCGFCAAECVNGVCQGSCSPSCFGRNCGDDGCGGSCGTCFSGQSCVNGVCQSVCTPNCAGRNCGDNGCGGSCGTCFSGQSCVNGVCQSVCTPSCFGRNCGDDGCGGSCGTCFSGQSCVNGVCQSVCTPNCAGRNCGDNGCGGSCGTCPSTQFCNNGTCQNVCTPSCVGRVCGNDGCGGNCGTCPNGLTCVDGGCSNQTCSCTGRECGYTTPGCEHACGVCAYDQFCTSEGLCSSNWSVTYNIVDNESACPDDTLTNCLIGPNSLVEIQVRLKGGDEVVVGPGNYCGGFTISTNGVRFTGQPGAMIVPCSSQWWEPAPPNCQAIDGAEGTPCSLANNLITLNASSIVISGFAFNGRVPNPLFNGTNGVATYSDDGTAIGAARAIANFQAVSGRSVIVNPITGVLICNNSFTYFEEAAVRVKVAVLLIQYNNFTKIGTVGAIEDGKRQGKTEKQRGSRKNKPGASVVLDDSGGEVVGNDISDCDYGGMDGGDYPPSAFPFKKRSCVVDLTSPRHTQFDYTTWSRNTIKNTLFGGVIVESKTSGKQEVFGNIIAETARGLIVENITSFGGEFEDGGLLIQENNMQGVGVASWTWKTDATTFVNENYQYVQTGIHLVGCNPFESNQPLASLYVNASDPFMDFAHVAFYVEDEPAQNPLCSTSTPITLQLDALGGLISRSDVGLQTSGNRVDATSVSVYTDESIDTKVRLIPNSLGLVASPQQVAPNCPPTCSGHGECAGINICECDNGYHDIDCSDQICGDKYCTVSENPTNCQADCLFRIKTTRVTLQFGGMIPTPSCCSVAAA